MTDFKVEVDPGEVAFDATRLDRIEGHFRDYVDDGRLAGWLVTVARDGKLVYVADYGRRDIEAGLPVEHDTIWRVYSMTKPITSLAAMMLWEQGLFDLNDPVEEYIPSFRNGRVYVGGSAKDLETTPVHQPVRIWNLLSHTSGLSYGFTGHPVDQGYLEAEKAATDAGRTDLEAMVDVWASQPLLFEPGTHWLYSRATDVVGRLVEVVSGQSLDAFFAEHIFGPIGMTDTAFSVPDDKTDRLASVYVPDPETRRSVAPAGRALSEDRRLLVRRWGSVRHRRRLPPLLPATAGRRRARRGPPRQPENHPHDGLQPPPRRSGPRRYGPRRFLRGVEGRNGLRARVLGRSEPGVDEGERQPGRVWLGRGGEHGVLGRSSGADHRRLLHPAAAIEHMADPVAPAPADLPGAHRAWATRAEPLSPLLRAPQLPARALSRPGHLLYKLADHSRSTSWKRSGSSRKGQWRECSEISRREPGVCSDIDIQADRP